MLDCVAVFLQAHYHRKWDDLTHSGSKIGVERIGLLSPTARQRAATYILMWIG